VGQVQNLNVFELAQQDFRQFALVTASAQVFEHLSLTSDMALPLGDVPPDHG